MKKKLKEVKSEADDEINLKKEVSFLSHALVFSSHEHAIINSSEYLHIATMPAKSLGTFPVICAIDEVQNPLPLKRMLFKRHMTSIIGISDTFPNS